MPPIRPLFIVGLLFAAGCAPEREAPKVIEVPKLGLTLSVPGHWQELPNFVADDNQFAVAEGGPEGAVVMIGRTAGLSLSAQHSGLSGEAVSRRFLEDEARPGGLLRVEEITIAGQRVACGVKESATPFPMGILRVVFWNEVDTYDVSAATRIRDFPAQEPVLKEVLQSIALTSRVQTVANKGDGDAGRLPALAVPFSHYAGAAGTNAVREATAIGGLPSDIERVRMRWETGWCQVLVRGDEMLQVRRSVVFLPGNEPGVAAHTMVVVDLEHASGNNRWSPGFQERLRDVLRAHLRGFPVDTRLEADGLAVRLRKIDGDLIIEYGRRETQGVLEALTVAGR